MSHCLPMNSHGVNDTKEETNSDRKVKTDILGIFLGRVGGTFWLWSGLQSLAVALVTVSLIYIIG